MNRAERRLLRRVLGFEVETTVLRCSRCGLEAIHVEVYELPDEPHGLPLELELCDCGGFLFSVAAEGGDAPD